MGKHSNATVQAGDLAIHSILNLIRTSSRITRADLGRLSGYSRSTISVNCEELIRSGLLIEETVMNGDEPGKRTRLRINGEAGLIIGIELGATGCELGVSDLEARLLAFDSIPVDLSLGPDPTMFRIHERLTALMESNGLSMKRLAGIGMGLPSSVDYSIGAAIHPAFMPGWHMYPVRDVLMERYGCRSFIDNEVNTMALGEYSLGMDRKYRNLMFVKAGTGIGAGIVVDGEIYRGEKGFAGNIGHILMEGYDDQCTCGKRGCLEAIAGGPSVARKALKIMEAGQSTILAELYEKAGTITAREVKTAADRGDMKCLALIREAGSVLGTLLGKMVMFFDPSVVIIGGGLAGFGHHYMSFIRDGILRQSSPWIGPELAIREATFGDKSGVMGSAMLCLNELFSSNDILTLRGK